MQQNLTECNETTKKNHPNGTKKKTGCIISLDVFWTLQVIHVLTTILQNSCNEL